MNHENDIKAFEDTMARIAAEVGGAVIPEEFKEIRTTDGATHIHFHDGVVMTPFAWALERFEDALHGTCSPDTNSSTRVLRIEETDEDTDTQTWAVVYSFPEEQDRVFVVTGRCNSFNPQIVEIPLSDWDSIQAAQKETDDRRHLAHLDEIDRLRAAEETLTGGENNDLCLMPSDWR